MGMDGLELAILKEISMMQNLDHPNIIKLHDVFYKESLLYYSLEYGPVDLGDLLLK